MNTKASELISDNPKAIHFKPRNLFDQALIGVASDGRLVYSEDKILLALQDGEGLSYEDALDRYALMSINTANGANRYAPIIVTQTA